MNQVYQDSLKKENRRNFQNLYNLEVSKDPLAFRGEPEAKIKTEICRNWESGNCEYGDKCFFAHGLKDLREKSNGKALKLQKCESFFKFGYCINGNKCQFRHTDITTDSAVNSLAPGKKKSRSSSQERHIAPVFVDLESRNLYSNKEISSSSIELHTIHCKRNYSLCECGELVHKQSLESHNQEKHAPRPCKHCGETFLPDVLALHECPASPKVCQFCSAEFPYNQFADHLYRCSSRTEQCPRCQKYIQIRDYDHHIESVDCLGVRDLFQERIDKVRNEVQTYFVGDLDEMESEVLKKLAEDEDREYAEELYKKILLERSSSRDSQGASSPDKAAEVNRERVVEEEVSESYSELPGVQRNVSESSYGISEDDQLINEAIMKSLQDR